MIGRRRIFGIQLGTVAVALAAYEALAHSRLLYEGVVPPLEAIFAALGRALANPATYGHLGVTASEALGGFAVGTIAGIAVGIPTGALRWLRAALGPYLDGIATAPKIVFFPIALLLFGTGPGSKAALAALSAFFPVALTVAAAVRGIRPVYVRVGRSFRCSPLQLATKIYIPALVPAMVTGMRIGLGLAIIGTLLGEIKLSNSGIGNLTIDHYNHFRIPQMYALLFLIFVLAVIANVALGRLEAGQRRLREIQQ